MVGSAPMMPMMARRILSATMLLVFLVSHASQHVRPAMLMKTTWREIWGDMGRCREMQGDMGRCSLPTVMHMPKSCEVTNIEKKRTWLGLG